ncbi:hypothetical protein Pla144_38840 [Bythopirellula polymerisocia]|uniref:Uncharacterized protein n=2 Tax=Bythopirellula polymerisocia TaxID=2528003 RepID=A0A5C6CLJ2_9BACT|nr:hypothetical protein Pla144_38840 [Bythopirellula polymerisocia]
MILHLVSGKRLLIAARDDAHKVGHQLQYATDEEPNFGLHLVRQLQLLEQTTPYHLVVLLPPN